MGLFFSQAWSLVLKQDLAAALGLFSTGQQVYNKAEGKVAGGERDRLDQVFLDHLAQQGECLAWHRLWPEYDSLSATVETLLRSCHHWVQSHPSIYVRCLEQRHSVTMLREKVALQDMMRAEDTEDVVDMMSTLSCSTDEIQVTPDISRKTTSRAGNGLLSPFLHISVLFSLLLFIYFQPLQRRQQRRLSGSETRGDWPRSWRKL